jgi:hypothetical protein
MDPVWNAVDLRRLMAVLDDQSPHRSNVVDFAEWKKRAAEIRRGPTQRRPLSPSPDREVVTRLDWKE